MPIKKPHPTLMAATIQSNQPLDPLHLHLYSPGLLTNRIFRAFQKTNRVRTNCTSGMMHKKGKIDGQTKG